MDGGLQAQEKAIRLNCSTNYLKKNIIVKYYIKGEIDKIFSLQQVSCE